MRKTAFKAKTITALIILSLITTASISLACSAAKSNRATKAQLKKFQVGAPRTPANEISKFAESTPLLESKLGNLLLEYRGPSTIISFPAIIQKSDYHPFGDGQSNAKLTFGNHWPSQGFPIIGIEEEKAGKKSRRYIFHPTLKVTSYKETDLQDGWFKVQPEGWSDAFYLSFNTSVRSVKSMVEGIPQTLRTFSGGRTAPNVAGIPKGAGSEGFKNLGDGYNAEPWYADSVHGRFPNANGELTALGGVLTWGIVDKKVGPFKNLYTCFEPRDVQKEKTTGAPSGAGWHHIGDAAETLLNSLETASLPVAVVRTQSFGSSAYGFTESVTATWLNTDEALISTQGTFHWYLNPYEKSVCTEIWVHNCVPSLTNSWGFNCQ